MRLGLAATVLLGICLAQLAVGGRALAAQPAPGPNAQPQPAPPPAPPGDGSPWMLPPGQAPPHGYPPPYAAPHPATDPRLALSMYENGKRSRGISLLCEFVFPGLGSVYADHARGALITWAFMAAGVGLFIYGLMGVGSQSDRLEGSSARDDENRIVFGMLGGMVLMTAGRVHGFVDAWRSTTRYNEALRGRLGLPAYVSLGPKLRLTF